MTRSYFADQVAVPREVVPGQSEAGDGKQAGVALDPELPRPWVCPRFAARRFTQATTSSAKENNASPAIGVNSRVTTADSRRGSL